MIIFKRTEHIRDWINKQKALAKKIGFVPTMGALHKGHLSLAEVSMERSDVTVVSIFVNPKQFNDPEDLKKYPRPIEEDIRLLISIGMDVLFLPDEKDIYPADDTMTFHFDPGFAGDVMEGKFRPGHFKGMAEVVQRLLVIIEPYWLYMGQKDFQQLMIIRKLISDLALPINLEMCPTVREPHGLAMSSRNVRLSPDTRKEAAVIYRTLVEAQKLFDEDEPIDTIKKKAIAQLTGNDFEPEYFEIVDGATLKAISNKEESPFVVACCAVRVEGIRLIDNAIWTKSE